MSNSPQKKPKFSVAIQTEVYQRMIRNTLGDPGRSTRFVATISSAVGVNPALQDCESGSIITAALLGESLNLSPSPQLGQYYMVPFKCKAKYDKSGSLLETECSKAQFILGYKGYLQLAMRSGNYKKINVMELKEGELVHFDPLNEEIECHLLEDYDEREKAPTAGYYAMFEYVNGFRKAMYWSHGKMLAHADKYSPAFSKEGYKKLLEGKIPDKDLWKYSSFWYKNFDDMAKKTMIRQLISRWGVMSTEMQKAYESDNGVVERTEEEGLRSIPVETLPAGEEQTAAPEGPPTEPEATQVAKPLTMDDIVEE